MGALMVREFLVILVGLDMRKTYKRDQEVLVGPSNNKIKFLLRGYRTLEEGVAVLHARHDVQLVHVSNNVRASRVSLSEGCARLAEAMAAHPNRPWVDFAYRNLNYLSPQFRAHGIRICETWNERADVLRWHDIARERIALPSQRRSA